MRHEETRDNTTTIEATIIEADEREELRTTAARQTLGLYELRTTEATWSSCECEDCRPYYEHHTDYDCP